MSEAKEPEVSTSPDVEIQAGMVVSLGSDSARLHATFIKYLTKAKKAGADGGFQQFKIGGKNWYRSKPSKPGDKNLVTFGFHEKYFVAGVGDNAVEHILARWNSPKPAWLAQALAQTVVPRRTGIIYLNLKLLREKLLPLAPSQKDAVAILELLGLDNADSLVSTTGLEDYGMINRVLLAFDGKPHGLLDMVADRPLTAKDLEPIPNDALFAMAARVDLNRTLKTVAAASEKAVGDNNLQKSLEEIKKQSGVELHYFLSSLGDTWCAYNSPTEGEVAFLGWTAVVPIRDRAKLLDSWEKLCAAPKKMQVANEDAGNNGNRDSKSSDDAPAVIRKCRFAGHEIYYVAGQAIAPAFYVSDREMVMTLNMPEMKAYLARKNHRSLATLPGVALALSDRNAPVALGFCDTPRLFDFLYPLISLYSTAGAAMAQQGQIELDPTFWPSAGAIRSHLRPDITTVERTPNGLQLTCRYCLPSGGANGPLWLIGLSVLGGGYENLVNLSPHTQSSSVCQQEPVGCAPVALPAPLGEQKPSSTISSPCCTAAAASPAPNSGSSYNTAAPVGTAVSSYGKTTPYGTAPALPAPSYGYPSSYGASVAPLPPSSGTSYKAAPANVSMPSLGYPSAVASSPNPYLSSPPLVPLGANYRAPMATPRAASAMTIADVVAMSRAGVDETLMVTQIHLQGLAAPLQASDIISLHQQGIGRNVIAALQAECATTAKRAAVHDDRSPRSPQGAAPTYRPHPYTPPSPPKQ